MFYILFGKHENAFYILLGRQGRSQGGGVGGVSTPPPPQLEGGWKIWPFFGGLWGHLRVENVKICAPGGAFLKKVKKILFERARAKNSQFFYSFITENH